VSWQRSVTRAARRLSRRTDMRKPGSDAALDGLLSNSWTARLSVPTVPPSTVPSISSSASHMASPSTTRLCPSEVRLKYVEVCGHWQVVLKSPTDVLDICEGCEAQFSRCGDCGPQYSDQYAGRLTCTPPLYIRRPSDTNRKPPHHFLEAFLA